MYPTSPDASPITVPPSVADKTRQKHVFGPTGWSDWYKRRTGVERVFGAANDTACEGMGKGRIRLMGRAKPTLMLLAVMSSVDAGLLSAFEERQASPPAPNTRWPQAMENCNRSWAA